MHFPDQVDGTFPMAGGMMMQCEPDVFEDEELMEAQRSTPMVIVHAKQDRVQNPSMSEGAYQRLLAHGFGNVKFLNPSGGHPYDFLPVNEAIKYLDALTTDDGDLLLNYGVERLEKKDWRTIGLVLQRAKEFDLETESVFRTLQSAFEEEAAKHADRYLKDVKSGVYGKWVDRFLKWHEKFSLATASEKTIEEWNDLVNEHSEAAKELTAEAQKAFNQGQTDQGWELRKKIVLEYYALPKYRSYKQGVEKRFGKLYKLAKKRR